MKELLFSAFTLYDSAHEPGISSASCSANKSTIMEKTRDGENKNKNKKIIIIIIKNTRPVFSGNREI